jgi:predicted dehydrogenase
MIRIGIVGCGRILAAHLRGYRLLREAGYDDFRVTALCARKAADARSYVRRGAGPAQRPPVSDMPGDPLAVADEYLSDFQDDVEPAIYTDFREMIADGPVDAVNDFTAHALHHEVAAAAFAAGKHLLTQKPLAVSMEAGRRMVAGAEAAGVALGVFENARNRDETRQLKWLLDSGAFGRLQTVTMVNFGSWWAPDRIVAQTPWRHRRADGGGIALDIGVHVFNVFRHLAGEIRHVFATTAVLEPERVTRDDAGRVIDRISCDAEDTVLATFDTEAGVLGQMMLGWAGHGGPTRLGGRGTVYHTDAARIADGRIFLDANSSISLSECYEAGCPADRRKREFPHGVSDHFALNHLDWLTAIQESRQPETSGREGLADMAAAYALLESAASGQRVPVRDVLDGTLRAYQEPIDRRYGLL